MLLFGITFEIQGDVSRAPVWKEGEGELQTSGDKVIGCERRLYTYLLLEPTPLLVLSLRQAAPSHHFNVLAGRTGKFEPAKRDQGRPGILKTCLKFFARDAAARRLAAAASVGW